MLIFLSLTDLGSNSLFVSVVTTACRRDDELPADD